MSSDTTSLDELYQELIVDHFKNPRCHGALSDPTCFASLLNPLCGDEIELFFRVKEDRVQEVTFQGKGCSISQASASMMCQLFVGKPVAEVSTLVSRFAEMMKGEIPQGDLVQLGDAASLQGVKRFTARIRCAMLSWEAAKLSLKKLEREECTV